MNPAAPSHLIHPLQDVLCTFQCSPCGAQQAVAAECSSAASPHTSHTIVCAWASSASSSAYSHCKQDTGPLKSLNTPQQMLTTCCLSRHGPGQRPRPTQYDPFLHLISPSFHQTPPLTAQSASHLQVWLQWMRGTTTGSPTVLRKPQRWQGRQASGTPMTAAAAPACIAM